MHILFFLHLSPAKVENTISHSCLLQTWSPKVWRSTWFLFCQLTFSSCAYAMLTTWTTKTNCGLLWMWLLVLSKRSPWWVWSVLFSIPIYSVKYTFIDSLCNFSFPLQLLENILCAYCQDARLTMEKPMNKSINWMFPFQTHQNDLALLSFWLSNMYQLLNCLKQYSGEVVKEHFLSNVLQITADLLHLIPHISYSVVHKRSSASTVLPVRWTTACRTLICQTISRLSATWPSASTTSSSPPWKELSPLRLVCDKAKKKNPTTNIVY